MKKPLNKKSLTYIRPEFGKFELRAVPGVELSFRKFTADDYAWVQETFGKTIEELTSPKAEGVQLSTLCRIYFQALSEQSKTHFIPLEQEAIDYDTGMKTKVLHPGWKLFMKAIDAQELQVVMGAFSASMLASKPLDQIPDDLKKTLEEMRGMSLS